MDHSLRFPGCTVYFLHIEIRICQIRCIIFDLVPAERGNIAQPQPAAEPDGEQTSHQRRRILKNQLQFFFGENLPFHRFQLQRFDVIKWIFFHGISQVRHEKCKNGLADALVAVQGRIAQCAAEFVILESFSLRTAVLVVSYGPIPASVLTDIRDICLRMGAFHFVERHQLIIRFQE